MPPTTAIGRYSIAPAAAFVTTGVTRAVRCRGNTTPVAPAVSARTQDRAEVARIGDAVERDEERVVGREQVVDVDRTAAARPSRRRLDGTSVRAIAASRSGADEVQPAARRAFDDLVDDRVVARPCATRARCAPARRCRPAAARAPPAAPSTCSPPQARRQLDFDRASRGARRCLRACPRARCPARAARRGSRSARAKSLRVARLVACGDERGDLGVEVGERRRAARSRAPVRHSSRDGGDQSRAASSSRPSSSDVLASRTSSNTTASAAGVSKSSSIASRNSASTSSIAASAGSALARAGARARRGARPPSPRRRAPCRRAPSAGGSASAAQQPERARVVPVEHVGERRRSCRATSTSSRRRRSPCRCAASSARTCGRRPRPARSRSRGAGTRGRRRRRGCRSPSPRISSDIAEHSMCQPGRPGPHGESHGGSPGFAAFHSAKSSGLRLRSSTSTRAPALSSSSSSVRCDSSPYVGQRVDLEVHALALDDVRVPARDELARSARCISSMNSVACGTSSGRSTFEPVELRPVVVLVRARRARARWCSAPRARAMILSSTSVTLLTYVTSIAAPLEVAADRVEHDRLAPVPEVRHVVRRRAAHVHRHRAFDARHEVDLRARGGVVEAEHRSMPSIETLTFCFVTSMRA